ncbi:Serine/threonine-protein kinase [Orbilia brochopaga]|uniref:non-specific serine/threonine protein kinase n=1 Tax=Orbilia brochopaga TaxID=3140254 RepID=A0AAV9V0C1_9PEZI
MGQGYSTTAPSAGAYSVDASELGDVTYERSLGTSRFMKSIRVRHKDGQLVVKIFAKPLEPLPLDDYKREVQMEQSIVADIPNALTYSRVYETERAAYLIRQNLYSSLYDRISTRPFLEDIEKRWITFQLLCGLRDCHAKGLHHGDIKAENVLITSWNWAYLADFAHFKPTYLPEDNPADFSYFFDSSGRRTCYLAPERFHSPPKAVQDKITDAMDIFSLGCVIAELFLEGTTLFNLSTLFKYKRGQYDPALTHLIKIEDPEIRSLVTHMINVDPSKRLSADGYLRKWRQQAFPDYFYSFLHQYMNTVADPTSGRSPLSSDHVNLGECDKRIDRIYQDFDKISFFLGHSSDNHQPNAELHGDMFPVALDIPNYQPQSQRLNVEADDGTLMFLTLINSSLRNTARARARLRACDLILAFAERVTDESKVDRCLPYLVSLLKDRSEPVQVAAVKAITQLMEQVRVVSPVNVSVFPDYILPNLAAITGNDFMGVKLHGSLVRATLGSCMASLAECASRFLDMAQALRADGSLPSADPQAELTGKMDGMHSSYDMSKSDLISYFEQQATLLLTDGDSSVRRAFLPCVSRLCVFFGRSKANDVLLSHLNTYLNDKDWRLKCAFFETIVGMATFVGSANLEEFILPLMMQALTDPEEFVIVKVLRSLRRMAKLGLFQKSKTWELMTTVSRFLIHPNPWIREAAISFLATSAKWLSRAEILTIVEPMLLPFLRGSISDVSDVALINSLKRPIQRTTYDTSLTWAGSNKSGFWARNTNPRSSAFRETALLSNPQEWQMVLAEVQAGPRNEEDRQWLQKLRNLGMTEEEERLLLLIKDYVYRTAQRRTKPGTETPSSLLNNVITLSSLDITPQTIFFEEINDDKQFRPQSGYRSGLATQLPSGARTPQTPLYPDRQPSRGSVDNAHDRAQASKRAQKAPSSLDERLSIKSSSSSHRAVSKDGILPPFKTAKATASIGLEAHNAVASFQPLHSPLSERHQSRATGPVGPFDLPAAPSHSYSGGDPDVLGLLDNMFQDNYPSDIAEFGPMIVQATRRQPIKRNTGRSASGIWKPDGGLVAQLNEHTGAVNRVVVAPDHTFFLTASDDGTVKLWDAKRLEKNVVTKARGTYTHSSGSKVHCLCFVENTYTFISAAANGSLNIVRIEYNGGPKAPKFALLREFTFPPGEVATWIEHFRADTASILMVATNKARVVALNLRTMLEEYSLTNPVHHGTPTCFHIDRKHTWMLLGTSHGILDLWDLRFKLRLRSWGLPGATPIHRLLVHPSKGRGKWICVAGGSGQGEITVWDVDKCQCREVYRATGEVEPDKLYEPWRVDDETPEAVLSRFASQILEPSGMVNVDRGVRAIAVGIDASHDESRSGAGFLITSGADRKMRFWDLGKVESSAVFSGVEAEEGKASYVLTHPVPSLAVATERPAVVKDSKKHKGSGRPPRSTVISLQQQMMLRSHLDSILDVAILEMPYGMVISADRSGVVLVHQ